MKRMLQLTIIMAAACFARTNIPERAGASAISRPASEEISSRLRAWLESSGVRLEDVAKAARSYRSRDEGGREGVARQADPVSATDQKNLNRITSIFNALYTVYAAYNILSSPPALRYSTEFTINASAQGGGIVIINLSLAELLSDSDDELSFAIAHELGHIVQQRVGMTLMWVPGNAEFDADVWAVFVCLVAGYNPYAGSGTLAKLSMATSDIGLAQQFEDQAAADAHKSFVSRIEIMYNALTAVCRSSADVQHACDVYRSVVHPHFPPDAVL